MDVYWCIWTRANRYGTIFIEEPNKKVYQDIVKKPNNAGIRILAHGTIDYDVNTYGKEIILSEHKKVKIIKEEAEIADRRKIFNPKNLEARLAAENN